MIELLRGAAQAGPGRTAVVTDGGTYSYGELLAAAEAVAAGLRSRGITRFAVVDPDARAVTALLAGSSSVAVEACQYPPDAEVEHVRELAERFDHDVIITSRADLADAAKTVLAFDEATEVAGTTDPVEDLRPLLILTTGTTTGVPRGVRHDWNRLLRGTRHVRPAPGQRWLLAYGLHQFAGLQVLLHVFSAGATLVAPVPRRPRAGLAAMRTHGVTHVSATPTYWRFLLAELRADAGSVPHLEQITLGGEAIPEPLLDELAATFPDARTSQVYAASEFGSSSSMRDGRAGLSVGVLERGADADVDMKIVDGEMWIRSHTSMLGYYGEAPIDPDEWRPTGDLVEIVGDRVFFRGRNTEIINVGGAKVHPLPIEERISAVAGVDVARVYGRPNKLTGAIVAVDVVARAGVDTDAIADAIRESCADLPAASRPRSIRFVETISMAGDKITRRTP